MLVVAAETDETMKQSEDRPVMGGAAAEQQHGSTVKGKRGGTCLREGQQRGDRLPEKTCRRAAADESG